MAERSLEEIIKVMHGIPEEGEFYALTLTATQSGEIGWSSYSHFVGYSEGSPRRELRAPSLVKPAVMASMWANIGQPGVVVRDEESLFLFLRIGGNALVEKEVARKFLSSVLEPIECAQEGMQPGFSSVHSIPESMLNHAPTPKVRMQILKRDEARCKICGRSPANHVDVELHVHHIRPWARGGLTAPGNLITLCHTCHKGLDPHEDPGLFVLLKQAMTIPGVDEQRKEYEEGVANYRRVAEKVWKMLPHKKRAQKTDAKSPKKKRGSNSQD